MKRVVAIKLLREVYCTEPGIVKRFQYDAELRYTFQHPNIVSVYDYGYTDGNYYMAMELIESTDLRRYLRSRGILDTATAVKVAYNVALGLGAAHNQGIVHRNVNARNILMGRDGSIKLTDFCMANVEGEVYYHSTDNPDREIVSSSTDIYDIGIVMYEMLTGHPVFDGDSPVAVAMQHIQDVPKPPSLFNTNISSAFEEIIMRCLEKAPERRFRYGSELARALESLIHI